MPVAPSPSSAPGWFRHPAATFAALLALGLTAAGEDPAPVAAMHRADAARSGYFPVTLETPLHPAWKISLPAPRPAWGAPARRSYWQRLEHLEPRVAYERVHPAVITENAVFIASSSADEVRRVELTSGRTTWTFFAEAPVRYAPVVWNGAVYFGSDDGWLYALHSTTGERLWRHRAGPDDTRVPGNGRMISPWPIRAGVLVDQGMVYATAGLYPQTGVWAYALDALTGRALWQEKLEASPEGYLLATDRWLVLPTGRSSPLGLSRTNGLNARAFPSDGGSFAVVSDEELIVGPGNDGALTTSSTRTRQRFISFAGRDLVATPQRAWLLGPRQLTALDRVRQAALRREAETLDGQIRELEARAASTPESAGANRPRLAELGRALAENREAQAKARLWSVPCAEDLALIGTATRLFAGGTNSVAAFDPSNGQRLWQAPITGQALALAAASGWLVVSTDLGGLEVFHSGPAPDSAPAAERLPDAPRPASVSPRARAWVERMRAEAESPVGYALVAGVGSGDVVRALVRESTWQVVVADEDPGRIAALQAEFSATGEYGTRISAVIARDRRLPFTDAFANVVIAERRLEEAGAVPWMDSELERVTRPSGGIWWNCTCDDPHRRGALPGAGSWTHQFGDPGNTAASADRHVTADLALQWFGGPGPDVMVDRHLRGPAPLSADGLLVVPGENLLVAVDAYNGTPRWRLELPGSQRYSMPYDAGYHSLDAGRLAVAVRDAGWVIDARVGAVQHRWPLPTPTRESTPRERHWGYVALVGENLLGTWQKATASRTTPSYEQIDTDYNHDQPLVTGQGVFALDAETGRTRWQREGGVLVNPTLAATSNRVYAVECRAPALVAHPTGRIDLRTLLAGDPWVIALDAATGALLWERRVSESLRGARSILYLAATSREVVLLGSRATPDRDTEYLLECLASTDGESRWQAQHREGKPGAFSHGEQVHHPVLLGDLLVAEPVVYDLATGTRRPSADGRGEWQLVRPGHSCGTLSGAGDCVFFRANNPTALDVRASLQSDAPPRKLAPSRTGCWINMIPAGGLLLIPEASAGCVCQYSLQTSMAFRPRAGLPR